MAVAGRRRRVAITIADDGPGIPEAELARLTARGARLDLGGPGAGLGLAIASEIAEAAGGSLALENAPAGLDAMLRLPAAPGPDGRLTFGVRPPSAANR